MKTVLKIIFFISFLKPIYAEDISILAAMEQVIQTTLVM